MTTGPQQQRDAPPTKPKKESSIDISKVEIAGFRCRNANRNTFGNKMVQPSFLRRCSWSIQWWWMLVTCDNKTEGPSMHPRNVDGGFIEEMLRVESIEVHQITRFAI